MRARVRQMFEAMKHDKEAVKLFTLSKLAEMTDGPKRENVALELYEIVPLLSEVMWDADDDVVASATETLGKCCETAGNRDLAPFAPTIIKCISTPQDVPECVHKLAATVFVQEIRSPALAVTVPLLLRGHLLPTCSPHGSLGRRPPPHSASDCVIS
jgi:elongation factor 3